MQHHTYFQEFVKHRRQVGSLVPSSRYLTFSMCNQIDFDKTSTIVELGPGTGVLTSVLLSKMKQDDQLFCVELHPKFCYELSTGINDPRLHIINGSAEELVEHLSRKNVNQVDCIISSLPLRNMKAHVRQRILDNCNKILKPSGQFIQYQYSLSEMKLIKSYFASLKIHFVLINIPPAFIYSCVKM